MSFRYLPRPATVNTWYPPPVFSSMGWWISSNGAALRLMEMNRRSARPLGVIGSAGKSRDQKINVGFTADYEDEQTRWAHRTANY